MSVSVVQDGEIAIVTIDNPPVNATSAAVRRGLQDAVSEISESDVKVALLTGQGRNFVAGADVSEFERPPVEPHLPDVIDRIEASSVPWVAVIHGHCLGGGLEIALGCRYRIAGALAHIGLPEVLIGLIPGAGGPQRLPRLIRMSDAVDLMTSGRTITALEALDLGLVDMVLESATLDELVHKSKSKALELAGSNRGALSKQAIRDPLDPSDFERKRSDLHKKGRGWTAPLEALDALWDAEALPFEEATVKSRARHLALRQSDQSKALRHAFFAERRAGKPDRLSGSVGREVSNVGVVGAGLMGTGIATSCLMAGYKVTVSEHHPEGLETGLSRIRDLIKGAQKRGKLSRKKASDALENLEGHVEMDCHAGSDLVIEAVFEDEVAKRDVFQELEKIVSDRCILATNTSYLNPESFTEGLANPDRIAGLHFFSPAHIMKLVEIVQCRGTSDETLQSCFEFAKRLGKIGVLTGICDGFVGNRILAAYRRAADCMLQDGALPFQIDAAMRTFGFPMGPYEMQDMAGLQISWANRKRQAVSRPKDERYVAIGDALCEMGRFGQKTGVGWYRYDEGSREPHRDPVAEELILASSREAGITRRSFHEEEIRDRLLAVMINEGARIVEEKIVARPLDVDVVKLLGYGFPRWRGGPMCYADQRGVDHITRTMSALKAEDPGSWKESDLLFRIANEGKRFGDLNEQG